MPANTEPPLPGPAPENDPAADRPQHPQPDDQATEAVTPRSFRLADEDDTADLATHALPMHVLATVIEDLETHPELREMLGTPVKNALVIVARGGALAIRLSAAAAVTDQQKKRFSEIRDEIVAAAAGGDVPMMRAAHAPDDPHRVPGDDDAADQLDGLLRLANREVVVFLERLSLCALAVLAVVFFISWPIFGLFTALEITILLAAPGALMAFLYTRLRMRRRIEDAYGQKIRALAARLGLSTRELARHIQVTHELLRHVW